MPTAFSQAALAEAKRTMDKAQAELEVMHVKEKELEADRRRASDSYYNELNQMTERLRLQYLKVEEAFDGKKQGFGENTQRQMLFDETPKPTTTRCLLSRNRDNRR